VTVQEDRFCRCKTTGDHEAKAPLHTQLLISALRDQAALLPAGDHAGVRSLVRGLIADHAVAIERGQSKFPNKLLEQDHRAIKWRARPMMRVKSFRSASRVIAGIETMQTIMKGQLHPPVGLAPSCS
jgi:DDE domain